MVNSLRGLIAYSYSTRPELVICKLPVCDSTLFDLQVRVDDADINAFQNLSSEGKAAMLQPVLSERFGVATHRDFRSIPVYSLEVTKGGSRMQQPPIRKVNDSELVTVRPSDGVMRFKGANHIAGYAVKMDAFCNTLTSLFPDSVGRVVVNNTHLDEAYDFDLKWAREAPASPEHDQRTQDPPEAPSLFTALQEQMGLRLNPSRVPMHVVVVDNAHNPEKN